MGASPEVTTDLVARGLAHRALLALALLCPLTMGALAFVLEPDARGYGTHEQLGLTACASMRYLDLPCPGCGVTTAVTLAYRGQPVKSLLTHPFGLLLAAAALAGALWALVAHLRGRDLARLLSGRKIAVLAKLGSAAWLLGWLYTLSCSWLGRG